MSLHQSQPEREWQLRWLDAALMLAGLTLLLWDAFLWDENWPLAVEIPLGIAQLMILIVLVSAAIEVGHGCKRRGRLVRNIYRSYRADNGWAPRRAFREAVRDARTWP